MNSLAEARAAVLQLRTLLVADAPIDLGNVRRLAEQILPLLPAGIHPMEFVETLAACVAYRDAQLDGMHHIDDPAGEAIKLLDAIDAEGPRGHRS